MTKPNDPIEPITTGMPPVRRDAHATCLNCASVLQGNYCHVCGQHAHNPLKSFKHAVEDVFESFWHVDGRILRTLLDLLVPGRASRAYLAGHRVRYIPPLRLYVILSLLTFFVAHFLAADIKGGFDIQADRAGNNPFAALTTEQAVEAKRVEVLADLQRGQAEAAGSQVADVAITTARGVVNAQAKRRIAELRGEKPARDIIQIDPGDEKPLAPLPDHPSLSQRLEHNIERNVRAFAQDRHAFAERMLTHAPGVLLVLVPLFALVLRLVYPLRAMGYLEHLVVALYSHAFLLLVALAWMLALLLDRASGGSVAGTLAAWILPPVTIGYLLFAQKRVYGDGWMLTLLRFAVTGLLYFALATLAFAAVLMMSLMLGA